MEHLNSIYLKLIKNFPKKIEDIKWAYRKLLRILTPMNSSKHVILLGFNALNKAEEVIFKTLVNKNKVNILGCRRFILSRSFHDAGLFLRQHMYNTSNSKQPLKWINNNYNEIKNITIYKALNSLDEAQIASQIKIIQ